jgi:hypothetical protein
MDQGSQSLFDRLVRIQPQDLTTTDIEFLKARAPYLSEPEREVFAEVLGFTGAKPAPRASKKAEK